MGRDACTPADRFASMPARAPCARTGPGEMTKQRACARVLGRRARPRRDSRRSRCARRPRTRRSCARSTRGISRGTEALVFNGKVPRSEHQRMRAPFQAGEFPGAREIRLLQRRRRRAGTRRARGPPRVLPLSAPDALRRPGRRVARGARRRAARRAPCSQRTSRRPSTLCGTRRRASAIVSPSSAPAPSAASWLGSRHASSAPTSSSSTSTSGKPPPRARSACRFALPAAARRDADVVIHASGSAAGLATALELAAVEATVVGAELVRRRAARRAARRRVPQPAPCAEVVAGRRRRSGAARALEPCAPHGARHAAARERGARCAHHRREPVRGAAGRARAIGRVARLHSDASHRLLSGTAPCSPSPSATTS